ncbi:MAG: UDP-2,3-diacylglucosamine diphosphatase LpxI [Alphaproteobacteria bacterium]|nr:UDP-2,3-diacylglucosamine diphosphatase LpxI [Alphaproteobacteria bacterium]MBP7757749.1 UDP-2,3-diacylglucosamine diphosphatase LpxI [Alphaproteobacteria bacterium]MBP7761051.1 UDP-2,3-diacylglucosamine diphosphatase LpxI [Alphaproteobacteria bacterium]MBP7904575.1 UDP-2,3-diacylglucosamine diphosphatase LpxI [Alphaproteobacteria bacterium]
MPAPEKVEIAKLGILAGGGLLPIQLAEDCLQKGMEIFIIGFEGQTAPELKTCYPHFWTGLGAAGSIFKALRAQGVKDVVLAGSIRRPWLSELRPDMKGMEILTRIGLGTLGDDGLLSLLKKEFEKEGFTIHGVHKFAQSLLVKDGVLTRSKPQESDWQTIRKGIEISQKLGELDIGQSVVVQEGRILGVEAAEGTDRLIARCIELQKRGKGAILVKTCKPQQDRDLDLPTIGPDTAKKAGEAGFSGIVIQAGAALILDPQTVAEIADKYNMFVLGMKLNIPEPD